jgi:hypothetical protein
MKRITQNGLPFAALLITLVFSACSKNGPAGPAGATGAMGATGSTGSQGAQGDTGPANVIYSEWTNGFSGTSDTWSVPAITQAVMDSSVILIYFQEGTIISQVPFTNVNGSGFQLLDLISVGLINLYCDSEDNLDGFSFRYVIIPGGVASDYVHLTYQEVISKFKITL